jgi:predicted RNase H-like nuclease (RuvC/YqgF family)
MNEQLQEAYKIVRENHLVACDKVDDLMRTESELKHQIEQYEPIAANLERLVNAMEAASRDPTQYRQELRKSLDKIDEMSIKLNIIQQKLQYTRNLMRNLDEAYNGLHWGILEESRLTRYCQENI